MPEIDLVYEQDRYNRYGVIIRENEIVTYWLGPRDLGAVSNFSIGAFLENPPGYIPEDVVRQVAAIVAGWSPPQQQGIAEEQRAERQKMVLQKEQAQREAKEARETEQRRTSIWNLPDPWRKAD